MNENYTINDIETLTFKDGVRQRIAMYLGSADMQGVYNAILCLTPSLNDSVSISFIV